MTGTESVLGAIAARARSVAAPRAAAYAAGNRTYQVQVTRPETEPTFNRALGELERHTPDPVYVGPARVMPVSPGGMTELGDAPLWWASSRVSIPVTEIDPRIDDIVTVLDDDGGVAKAGDVAGRRFRVTGVNRGGLISIGVVLDVVGIEASRESPL